MNREKLFEHAQWTGWKSPIDSFTLEGQIIFLWQPTFIDDQGRRVVDIKPKNAKGHYIPITINGMEASTLSEKDLRELVKTTFDEAFDKFAADFPAMGEDIEPLPARRLTPFSEAVKELDLPVFKASE